MIESLPNDRPPSARCPDIAGASPFGQLKWDNLGYWHPGRDSYPSAAERLARQVWRLAAPSYAPRVLDVGAGHGAQLGLWQRLGARNVLALEPDARRAADAAKHWRNEASLEVLQATAARTVGLPKSSRDLVVALDALYHFDNRAHFFSAVRGVLDDDGCLSFSTLVLPEFDALKRGASKAAAWLFEMPNGVPTEAQLRAELARAGFGQTVVEDWSEPVLGGFAAFGAHCVRRGDGWRRRTRVAATQRGCRTALNNGIRYVGVSAKWAAFSPTPPAR